MSKILPAIELCFTAESFEKGINNMIDDAKAVSDIHNKAIRIQEIRNLLERVRVAWERRPEMDLSNLLVKGHQRIVAMGGMNCGNDISRHKDELLITAIEKLCSEER